MKNFTKLSMYLSALVMIAGSLFVSSCSSSNDDPPAGNVLTLGEVANKTTIVANNSDQVTFKVALNGAVITSGFTMTHNGATFSPDANGAYTFVTTEAGQHIFKAKHGNTESNEIIITATAVEPGTPVLTTVDGKNEITADGEDTVTFIVTVDGQEVKGEGVQVCNGDDCLIATDDNGRYYYYTEEVPEGGILKFYATYNEVKSAEIAITVGTSDPVPAGTPVLTTVDDKNEITADGEDTVTFIVTVDGEEVKGEGVQVCNGDDCLIATDEDGRYYFYTEEVPEGGILKFYATYNDVKSAEIAITVKETNPEPAKKPVLTTVDDKTEITANGEDAVAFIVTVDGEEVKGEGVQVCNGDDCLIATDEDGRYYYYTDEVPEGGILKFYATYNDVKSDEITINVVPEEGEQPLHKVHQNVFLIRFSADWCPPCGSMSSYLSSYQTNNPNKLVWMILHSGSNSSILNASSILYNRWNTFVKPGGSIPAGTYNFRSKWVGSQSEANIKAKVDANMAYPATTAFQTEATIVDGELTVDVKTYAAAAGEYNIGVLLLEDGIAAPQAVGGQWNNGFIHNGVCRAMLTTAVIGESLGEMAMNDEVSKTFTSTLNSKWVADNCKLLIYSTKSVDGVTIIDNAVYASVNGTTPFEFED